MMKCPFCQFENEDGVLFCEQCKSDLGVAEPVGAPSLAHSSALGVAQAPAPAVPHAAVSEVASPLAAVAIAEATVTEAVPVAQVDAGIAAAAEVPIAVAVPLAETSPVTVAPEASQAAVALAGAAPAPVSPEIPAAPPPPGSSPEKVEAAQPAAAPAAPTAPDTSSPIAAAHEETAAPPAAAEPPGRLPPGTKPKLVVLRGQRINVEYPLYEGDNYLGRTDEKAVDIDLEDQEPPDRIWSSRQHALITYEDGTLAIEDLNSTNGTFVNRMRVHPGQKRPLQVNDVIQIGTVQMKVKV